MKKIAFLFCIFTLVFSCRKVLDKPHWNTDVLAPLVQSSLSLKHLLQDTASFKKNQDNSITLVNRSLLANVTLDTLVTLNAPPYIKNLKLDSLVLDTKTTTTTVSLGQIANGLISATPPNFTNILIGYSIISNNHQTYSVPNLNGINAGSFDLDVTSFFQTADIKSGNLQISIKNGLPLTLNNVQFDVSNKISGSPVVNSNFPSLPPGSTQSVNKNLAAMTVEGKLLAHITFDIQGGTVLIDTSNAIEVSLSISGVKVNSATAIFPAQNVINNSDTTGLVGMKDIELTYAKIGTGVIRMEVVSTVQDNIYFNYIIPSATKNGNTFNLNLTVPPATPGQPSVISYDYDFSDYELDLTGQTHTDVNTFYSTIIGRIEYTGQEVFLSLNDSLSIKISTVGLKPSYIKGYLGRDTINVGPASVDLDVFNKIAGGSLNFENVSVNVSISNGTGLPGGIKLNSLQGINTKNNSQVNYTGPVLGNNISIPRATDNPLTASNIVLDLSSNSNALAMLDILPSKINYNLQVTTNPNGNDHTRQDFAYSKDSLDATLDIELPLSIISDKLVLIDTVVFNAQPDGKQSITKGTFNIYANNGFPIDAGLKIFFLNENNIAVDSVTSLPPVKAASLDINGRVSEKRLSTLSFTADENKMHNIYFAKKAVFRAEFTTMPAGNFLKIYSDYSIDFKLVGDLNYAVQ